MLFSAFNEIFSVRATSCRPVIRWAYQYQNFGGWNEEPGKLIFAQF